MWVTQRPLAFLLQKDDITSLPDTADTAEHLQPAHRFPAKWRWLAQPKICLTWPEWLHKQKHRTAQPAAFSQHHKTKARLVQGLSCHGNRFWCPCHMPALQLPPSSLPPAPAKRVYKAAGCCTREATPHMHRLWAEPRVIWFRSISIATQPAVPRSRLLALFIEQRPRSTATAPSAAAATGGTGTAWGCPQMRPSSCRPLSWMADRCLQRIKSLPGGQVLRVREHGASAVVTAHLTWGPAVADEILSSRYTHTRCCHGWLLPPVPYSCAEGTCKACQHDQAILTGTHRQQKTQRSRPSGPRPGGAAVPSGSYLKSRGLRCPTAVSQKKKERKKIQDQGLALAMRDQKVRMSGTQTLWSILFYCTLGERHQGYTNAGEAHAFTFLQLLTERKCPIVASALPAF